MSGQCPVVELSHVTKRFGPRRGVTDLDLVVEPGGVFGFLGPNGAGKSTTIRLMLGLYRPTSGRARLFGQDVTRAGAELRRRVGYLPGEVALHPRLTAAETLARFARIRGGVDGAYVDGLVSRFGAELNRPLRALSKGNRQKIGLVLALMHDPELLVLDEPTSGLDPLLQRTFADLLEELVGRGRTVFLSSHDLEEVQRLAHSVGIIREGRLVAVDTVDGLRSRSPRTMTVTFRSPVDPAEFTRLDGVQVTAVSGAHLALSINGRLPEVLAAVARHEPVDIVARPADLDELFRGFYTTPTAARTAVTR
jgi:ABC-2 type transport system ATP-binding protein